MTKIRIYVNIMFLVIIIVSYIGLLCFISNEGMKSNTMLPRHGAIDTEMLNQITTYQETDFHDIKLNKNLINID
ncbi:hypothetical protein IJG14_03505 [bacterium]|nr:hypothetical protein [bacterium]